MLRAFASAALSLMMTAAIVTAARAQSATPAPGSPAASCAEPNAPGRTLKAFEPDAPAIAAHYGVGGVVDVRVEIDATGRIEGTSIVSSSSPIFNASALYAARRSTFAPALRNCVPVPGWYTFTVDYAPPDPLPQERVHAFPYLRGTWRCTAPGGDDRTLAFAPAGPGFEMSDGSVTTTLLPDQYRMWRIRRSGQPVGWAFPWVDETWEWNLRGTDERALRLRRIDDAAFALTTSTGNGTVTMDRTERCARVKRESAP